MSAPTPADVDAVNAWADAHGWAHEDVMAFPDDDDIAQLATLRALAREEERETCCRDVCIECRVGRPVYRRSPGEWRHDADPLKPGGILLPYGRCQAGVIRERGLKEQ